jgi:hypothetical protein
MIQTDVVMRELKHTLRERERRRQARDRRRERERGERWPYEPHSSCE